MGKAAGGQRVRCPAIDCPKSTDVQMQFLHAVPGSFFEDKIKITTVA